MQSPNKTSPAAPIHPKRTRSRWPFMIALMLCSHAAIMIGAITLAVSDRSFAVVPHYYEKSIKFDQRKIELQTSTMLGWTLQILPGSLVDENGQRLIIVKLADRNGYPIDHAHIELTYYHLAHSKKIYVATLTPRDIAGQYQTIATMPIGGYYQIESRATVADQSFLADQEIVVPTTPPSNVPPMENPSL